MTVTRSSYVSYLRSLINTLPLDTVDYAFAYGSGAIEQQGEDINSKTIDFIIATRDPFEFHRKNLELNPNHYSALRLVGWKNLSILQSNFAAHIYYNTMITSNIDKRTFKYGVIGTEDLLTDLLDWRWLYAAGRLHKPVLDIIGSSTIRLSNDDDVETTINSLQSAILENRQSAVHAALLQMSDSFTFEELFQQIIAISYTGDFRMQVGEDRNKVHKILHGSFDKMMEIYSSMLAKDTRLIIKGNRVEQDNSSPAIYHRLNLLPWAILNGLSKFHRRTDFRERDIEEIVFSMAHRHDVSDRVREAITGIVRPVAFRQTLINGLSAGVIKSIQYSSAKLLKMLKSL